jgi:hypothetical protein
VKTYTKETLKKALREIADRGWIPSHRDTSRTRNDGAAGNLLEQLLGIEENNLPLPNANEWELKVSRADTSSLVTLLHSEPSPRTLKFVPSILLPKYGWRHKEAGDRYSEDERSFRMTMNAGKATDRGFIISIESDRLCVSFDSTQVDERHSQWLKAVKSLVGNLNDFDPAPYWGFDDIQRKIAAKLHNTVYVVAERRHEDNHEWFRFSKASMLSGFSLSSFLDNLRAGSAYVEFDARTGHNHGTKFRVQQRVLPSLYANNDAIFDLE